MPLLVVSAVVTVLTVVQHPTLLVGVGVGVLLKPMARVGGRIARDLTDAATRTVTRVQRSHQATTEVS